jgi:hypothetical protein
VPATQQAGQAAVLDHLSLIMSFWEKTYSSFAEFLTNWDGFRMKEAETACWGTEKNLKIYG